ncbi:uncharacterized protein LOC124539011 [Vanessa cardui]|uniref:uncharacterized protein LOC124539011 n=1 Tax=Vanessa cardui TaxID=171605 RepID=UPI001F145A20|nr:uncharacterized protein LOC124539011 [Vanessa cardui]
MLLWCIYFVLFVSCGATVSKYDVKVKEKVPLNNNLTKQYINITYNKNNFTKNVILKSANSFHVREPNKSGINLIAIVNKEEIYSVLKHLRTIGALKISASVKCMKRIMQPTHNIKRLADTSIQHYASLFNGLMKKIPEDAYENNIDKEFIILNLVVTANEIVYDINKNILRKIINQTKITPLDKKKENNTIINVKEELYDNYLDGKKEYMEYICLYYKICRMYPAYSDYIAVVINEILKLPRNRFNYFMTNFIVLMKEQANFFKTFLGDKLVSKINDNLEEIFYRDIKNTRTILISLQKLLLGKHKLISPNNKNDKTILKAIIILIDIVDKAFDNDENDMFSIFFDNTIIFFRNWAKVGEENIARSMGNFVRHFVNTLRYNWKTFVREEVKTLLDIIITGKTKNKEVYKYLFTEGSRFVKSKPETKSDGEV